MHKKHLVLFISLFYLSTFSALAASEEFDRCKTPIVSIGGSFTKKGEDYSMKQEVEEGKRFWVVAFNPKITVQMTKDNIIRRITKMAKEEAARARANPVASRAKAAPARIVEHLGRGVVASIGYAFARGEVGGEESAFRSGSEKDSEQDEVVATGAGRDARGARKTSSSDEDTEESSGTKSSEEIATARTGAGRGGARKASSTDEDTEESSGTESSEEVTAAGAGRSDRRVARQVSSTDEEETGDEDREGSSGTRSSEETGARAGGVAYGRRAVTAKRIPAPSSRRAVADRSARKPTAAGKSAYSAPSASEEEEDTVASRRRRGDGSDAARAERVQARRAARAERRAAAVDSADSRIGKSSGGMSNRARRLAEEAEESAAAAKARAAETRHGATGGLSKSAQRRLEEEAEKVAAAAARVAEAAGGAAAGAGTLAGEADTDECRAASVVSRAPRKLFESTCLGDEESRGALRVAADRGDHIAQGYVSLYAISNTNPSKDRVEADRYAAKSIEKIRVDAIKGNPDAQYILGKMHQEGLGGAEKSDVKAVAQYEKAVAQDHSRAQFTLGMMYETGRGVPAASDVIAVKWYTLGATGGDPLAQYALARMYESGRGVPAKDYAEAAKWHSAAARKGYKPSEAAFAAMQASGRAPKA